MKSIQELVLHEKVILQAGGLVIRVPGGWLYALNMEGVGDNPVFVPYSDEFNPKKVKK